MARPSARFQSTAFDSNNAVAASAMTDATGRFWLALPPGTYTLKLSKLGYVDKTLTFSITRQTFYADLGAIVTDYSLSISLPLTFIELPALSSASIPISLSNKGPSTEKISVSVDRSCDLDVGVYAGGVKVSGLSLGPGDSQTLALRVKAPYMEPAVCAITLRFLDSITHERGLTVAIVKEPLQLVSSALASVRAAPGSMLGVPVRISNRLSDSFTARLSVELPGGWSGVVKDAAGNIVSSVSLNPGESVQATLHLSIPRAAEPGSYSITLTLIGASPYFIDSATLTVSVAMEAPILRISAATPHVDAYAGKSAKYQVALANFGGADCLARFNVTGLPQGYAWSIADPQGNVLTQAYLPAGGSTTLLLTVSVPPLAEPGTLSFKLTVEAPLTRDEVALSLGVLGRYAVSFVTQNFYLETTPGSTASFQLSVSNTGYSSLTNVALTATSVPEGFSVSIEPRTILLLKPGENGAFTVTVAADHTLDAGDYYVTLTLKADQLDSISRDLHVHVRAVGGPAYAAAAIIAVLIAAAALIYRWLGRR